MTGPAGGAAPLLALDGIDKRYGGTVALAGVSLRVRAGTVHALLGENGAGKTTLMRVVYGLTRADAGTMRWRGAPLAVGSPRDALAAGIGMVQQHFSLVPALSVAENVALGGSGLFSRRDAERTVRELAAATGLPVDERAIAGELPVGAQQRVEILKALARGASLLILDEPTATLAPDESRALLRWAGEFASGGRSVVLITHKLRDALSIADDVTVLRRGRVALASAAAELTQRALAAAMLGEPADAVVVDGGDPVPSRRGERGPVVARLAKVSASGARGATALHDASLEVHAGEIVGVAAVEGNGERELLRILAGRERPARGTAELPPSIGYIPQDRHADAIADEMSLVENVALANAGRRRGWIDWSALRASAVSLLARYDVRAPGPDVAAATLSGGNQQRFVLAREIDDRPALLVADQPTRGLDLRATAEVHHRLRDARDAGSAVVVHSADLDEVLALADRVVVVARGRVDEVQGGREAVGRAMLGQGEGQR